MLNQRVELLRRHIESLNFKLTKKGIKYLSEVMLGEFIHNHPKSFIDSGGIVNFTDDTPFLTGYDRIVIGAHGPYIEFDNEHLLVDLHIPKDQLWRDNNSSYNVKYLYKQPVGRGEKIYHQLKTVDYADYKVEKYYIDFYLTHLSDINNSCSTNLNRL